MYVKLYDIFKVLNSDYIESVKSRLTGAVIRDWFWAMYEEMRQFFNNIMTPQELVPGGRPRYPVSTMDTLVLWIGKGQTTGRITYPAEWRLLNDKEEREKRAVEQYRAGARAGGDYYSSGARAGGDYCNSGGGDREGSLGGKLRGAPSSTGAGAPGEGPSTKHVHPKIAQVMRPLWSAHGPSVKFDELLFAANLKRFQLPTWTPAYKKKKHMLCYGHTCGHCRFGPDCIFIHVDGKDLNDGFASEFATKIKPGVDYMTKQPAVKKEQENDGGAAKKQRHA